MRTWRRLLWVAFVFYLSCTLYLVWSPHPEGPSAGIDAVVRLFEQAGFALRPDWAEKLLNVIMFVPLSLIGRQLWPQLTTAQWTLIGFCATLIIESGQRTFLPSRVASSSDIVTNTLGALIGAVLGWALLRIVRRVAPPDESVPVG